MRIGTVKGVYEERQMSWLSRCDQNKRSFLRVGGAFSSFFSLSCRSISLRPFLTFDVWTGTIRHAIGFGKLT